MHCRKKNRWRWRQRVMMNRAKCNPRGQSVSTPTVCELLVRDKFGFVFVDAIGLKRVKCRSIRNMTRQRLERER